MIRSALLVPTLIAAMACGSEAPDMPATDAATRDARSMDAGAALDAAPDDAATDAAGDAAALDGSVGAGFGPLYETIGGPRSVRLLDDGIFGSPASAMAGVVVGEDGVTVQRFSDGERVYTVEGTGYWHGEGLRIQTGAGVDDILVVVGPDGPAAAWFEPGTGFGFFRTFFSFGNTTDLDAIRDPADPTLTEAVLVVNNTSSSVHRLTPDESLVLDETGPPLLQSPVALTSSIVSIHPSGDGLQLLGVTETELFHFDGTTVTVVDDTGVALRGVECAGQWCITSDEGGDGTIRAFLWSDPAIPPNLDGAVRYDGYTLGAIHQTPSGEHRVVATTSGDASLLTAIVERALRMSLRVDAVDELISPGDPLESGFPDVEDEFAVTLFRQAPRSIRVGVRYTF